MEKHCNFIIFLTQLNADWGLLFTRLCSARCFRAYSARKSLSLIHILALANAFKGSFGEISASGLEYSSPEADISPKLPLNALASAKMCIRDRDFRAEYARKHLAEHNRVNSNPQSAFNCVKKMIKLQCFSIYCTMKMERLLLMWENKMRGERVMSNTKKKLPLAFWIFTGLLLGILAGMGLMKTPEIATTYIKPCLLYTSRCV